MANLTSEDFKERDKCDALGCRFNVTARHERQYRAKVVAQASGRICLALRKTPKRRYLLAVHDLPCAKDRSIVAIRATPAAKDIKTLSFFLRERILCGYNFRRSGDIIVCVEPGYYEYAGWSSPVGTTHGEWNPYDAHIPLLFYGWKVPHGASPREVHIVDIAPTVCSLIHIQQPNACIGESLQF